MLTFPERSALIRRAAARLCRDLNWAPLHEMRLPNGRRADLLALSAEGNFLCIEVKSGLADFQADTKWPEYRDFCDELFFAVDFDFPVAVLPQDTGLIVASDRDAAIIRPAPRHPLPPARRRALLQRFAWLAACRLEQASDPMPGFVRNYE